MKNKKIEKQTNYYWKQIIDFTKIEKDGIDIEVILEHLNSNHRTGIVNVAKTKIRQYL